MTFRKGKAKLKKIFKNEAASESLKHFFLMFLQN